MTVSYMILVCSCTNIKLADKEAFVYTDWNIQPEPGATIRDLGGNRLHVYGNVVITDKKSQNKFDDPFDYRLGGYMGKYFIELSDSKILYEIPLALGTSMQVSFVRNTSNMFVCDEFILCMPASLEKLKTDKFTGLIDSKDDYYISLLNEFKGINDKVDYEIAYDFLEEHSVLKYAQASVYRDFIRKIRALQPRVAKVEITIESM
jgi:hypothetical protein